MKNRVRTEYQEYQRGYINDLREDFMYRDYYDEVKVALEKTNMCFFYKALLSYISIYNENIAKESLTGNKDDLTFYVSYDGLRKECEFFKVKEISDWQLSTKLEFLCYLGLLNNIEGNAYELVDLAPQVIKAVTIKTKCFLNALKEVF